MLGPRSMGTGTPCPGPSSTSSKWRQDSSDTYDTFHLYGGIAQTQTQTQAQAQTPAQRLIEQYERLNTPPQTPPPLMRNKSTYSRQYVYDHTAASNLNSNSVGAPYDKDNWKKRHGFSVGSNGNLKKDRSPIRQSLRNLLSVFKKGAGGLTKRKSEEPNLEALPCFSEDHVPPVRHSKEDNLNLMSSSELEAASSRPRKKMTARGSLLYLSRGPQLLSPDIPGPLMWTTCSVTLDESKLMVSSFTGEMEMSVHEIILSKCTDIRSLSVSQLSAEEARLLDEVPEGDKMKVFEVLFDGRDREKFAAKSVRERAGWISAIWDAILPSQDMKPTLPSKDASDSAAIHESQANNHVNKSKTLLVQSPMPTPLPQPSSLLNPSSSDRSLPPLPPKSPLLAVAPHAVSDNKIKKAPNLHLDLSKFEGPISPSIYPPTSCAPSFVETPASYVSSLVETPVSNVPPLAETPDENLKTLQQLLRIDTSVATVRKGGGGSSVVISPSIYLTSRSGSTFVGSPVETPGSAHSTSRPSTPSVANLSQLSVVRKRLAQIERNHSQLSSHSGISGFTARVSTPSPVSPAGSAWAKREAIFHNTATRTSRHSATSPLASKEDTYFPDCRDTNDIKGKGKARSEDDQAPLPFRSSHSPDRPSKRVGVSKHDEKEPPASPANPVPSKEDIRKLSSDLAGIKGVLGGESGYPTIHQMVVGLENRAQGGKQALRVIQDTLSVLSERVTGAITAASVTMEAANHTISTKADPPPTERDDEAVLQALKELKDRVSTEFPAFASKLQDIKEAQERDRSTAYNNLAPPSPSSGGEFKLVDLQPVLTKLEEIRALSDVSSTSSKDEKQDMKDDTRLSESVAKIFSLIQEDGNKQTLLAQQQADSVRYLNELNTWLEAFVNNGTSQIQGISANIDRLCKEIGCNSWPPAAFDPNDGAQSSLMNDIRQLVVGMKARDQNFSALQAAVHSLLEVLTVSQAQKGADSQAIAGLMDQQRHDQEVLFRTFTDEISGEIKGERLRFVEAMKEATAINVQLHVEHFKQELGREVMAMTKEVGRLHREKQVLENQISDLFAFYSKHKQADMPLQSIQPNTGMPVRHTQEKPRANIPRSHQRLLPYPHQMNQGQIQ